MDELIIDEHALKHGLTAEEISYAWNNFLKKQYRGAPNEGEIVAIGYDRKGRAIEIIAADRAFGVVVFHAMEPPTAKVLIELGLARR
mgnify:CR=1 FL=1